MASFKVSSEPEVDSGARTNGDDGVGGAGKGNAAAAEEEKERGALYSDSRALGWEFWASVVVGTALIFAINLAFSTLVTFLYQQIVPIRQICECPTNAATISPSAVFYDGCVNNASQAYRKYNLVPGNTTFEAKGWFYPIKWSRQSLRERDLGVGGAATPESAPLVYECPVFRPFWQNPVDIVGIVLYVIFTLFYAWGVATATVRKNEVFADCVQLTWFGGARTVVPLYAIAGEPVKHELAGIPPIRGGAMVLKATETVSFQDSSASGISTRLKGKKTTTVRVEPKDKEAFLASLAAALENVSRQQHFFATEMPALSCDAPAADDTDTIYYESTHRVGYWLRLIPIFVLFWVVFSLAFNLFIYLIKELVQPGRPKVENDFVRSLFNFPRETIVISVCLMVYEILIFFLGHLQSLPSKVVVHPVSKSLQVKFDRVTKICGLGSISEARPATLVVALGDDNIISASPLTGPDGNAGCVEKVLTFPFEELNGIRVYACRFYVNIEDKSKWMVKRVVAKQKSKGGKAIEHGAFTALYPPPTLRSRLLNVLRNDATVITNTPSITPI